MLPGPGSPSYALRHWAGGPIPDALADKLAGGGIVTFASAAALTLGVVTSRSTRSTRSAPTRPGSTGSTCSGRRPGCRPPSSRTTTTPRAAPTTPGSATSASAACAILERALPAALRARRRRAHRRSSSTSTRGRPSVRGLGGVTVRVQGRSRAFAHGTETTIDALAETVHELRAARSGRSTAGRSTAASEPDGTGRPAGETLEKRAADGPGPVRDEVAQLEGTFIASLGSGDVRAAVGALIALDQAIERRVGAGEDSPDLQAARATFRSLIVRLGDGSGGQATDLREAIEPFVEALVQLRGRAAAKRLGCRRPCPGPAGRGRHRRPRRARRDGAGPSARPSRADGWLNRNRGLGARPRPRS